ncbi:MAG: tRNA uridine(34) 5-carboxymethylaminomethyl modification radical SAM/GNAT enzyme Elp3 [Candidatus Gracilibacteria bacterium]|jgi:elongator complex protein 3
MDFTNIDFEKHRDLACLIIQEASKRNLKDRHEFEKFRNRIVKEEKGVIFHNLYLIKAYYELVDKGVIKLKPDLLNLIRKRSVRTLSGVAPVTVLTKPYPCPGRCVYCPTDVMMPKSYLRSQPAAQRALRQKFDPYDQVVVRLRALVTTGHEISKVELRIVGGTWSSYPKPYQKSFIKRCIMACNEFYGEKSKKNSFDDVVRTNETAKIRIIGINIETRPDYINESEVKRLRDLGVTKVEMGVQTTSEAVQKLTGRGHTLKEVTAATKLLKDAGFKIGYHMMPNLPGSTPKMDIKMIEDLFKDDKFQPDYLKIYPCVVVPKTILSFWFKQGKYNSYSDKILEDVIYEELKRIPYWCRVDRVARDIPSTEVESGFKSSNVRQIIENRLIKEGVKLKEIRGREVGNDKIDPENIELVMRKYKASGGEEIFLSYEDKKKNKLIALLRLRLPKGGFLPVLKNAAIIREIHVYGQQVAVGSAEVKGQKQHTGLGTKLIIEAEKLARVNKYKKIAVISGIGTREYYKKFGYKLLDTYMVKSF